MNIDENYLQKLMRTISHDMGGTLRTAVGFSTLILDNYKDDLDEKVLRWLSLIKSEGEKTQTELVALSRYARLYGVEDVVETCDLSELVKKALDISSMDKLYPGFKVDVDEASLPPVEGFKRLWVDYFAELIVNSARYSGGAPSIRCRVYGERDDQGINIMVEDNGVGMTQKQREFALQPFRSVEGAGPTGSGIGIPIAKRIAELHEGLFTMEESSSNETGLKVVVQLPIRG